MEARQTHSPYGVGNRGDKHERRTKIMCTIGPSCGSVGTLERMLKSGMDAARLNFSHGDHESHADYLKALRRATGSTGKTIAILQDLQGPKIRLGRMAREGMVLEEGRTVRLTTGDVLGDAGQLPVDYPGFQDVVEPGHRILLDDGLIIMEVARSVRGSGTDGGGYIEALIMRGGPVFSRKGINLPDSDLVQKGLTAKDLDDLRFGIENDVDFVGLSFVDDAGDVKALRRAIDKSGSSMMIIAKIERAAALRNIDEIIYVSDGVLVARGDLGIEIPIEELPLFQKDLIKRCGEGAKPVITATHMLESMIKNRMPTRAEVLDIANAVMDGTDAVMLSGETAIGRNPVDSVKMMARIVKAAERGTAPVPEFLGGNCRGPATDRSTARAPGYLDVTRNVAVAAGKMAEKLRARAVIAFTMSGTTALMLSKTRGKVPVLALTPDEKVRRQMSILWGVTPIVVNPAKTTDEMIVEVERTTIESGLLDRGDLVVLTAGVPLSVRGRTNMIKVHVVGSGHWSV